MSEAIVLLFMYLFVRCNHVHVSSFFSCAGETATFYQWVQTRLTSRVFRRIEQREVDEVLNVIDEERMQWGHIWLRSNEAIQFVFEGLGDVMARNAIALEAVEENRKWENPSSTFPHRRKNLDVIQ